MPHPTSKLPVSYVLADFESRRPTAAAALHFTRHSLVVMSLRTILQTALVLVTIGGPAFASAQSISSEPRADALIVGQVIDSSMGTGIGGALVTLSRINEAVALDASNPQPRTVVSTANGRYVFRDPGAGRYTIVASKPGYVAGGLGSRRPGAPPGCSYWPTARNSTRPQWVSGGMPLCPAWSLTTAASLWSAQLCARCDGRRRAAASSEASGLPPQTTGASIASLSSRQGSISSWSDRSLPKVHYSTRRRSMRPRGRRSKPPSSRWRRATTAPALISCCQPHPAFASADDPDPSGPGGGIPVRLRWPDPDQFPFDLEVSATVSNSDGSFSFDGVAEDVRAGGAN